jgi:hypothetical protein
MSSLSQNLYITYSNQKVRDLKSNEIANPLDKVITLDSLILEIFESKNLQIIIDDIVASSIIYKIIQDNNIKYFLYLNEDALSLKIIYDFIVKCKRNEVTFEELHSGEKLDAIVKIDELYQEYKKTNNLVDIADIESIVLGNWDSSFLDKYAEVYIDMFRVEDISYIKSFYQEKILEKFADCKSIYTKKQPSTKSKIIKPSHEVLDNIDEVKTAIKIARKLLEDGVDSKDILIVASDIQEYAPLYKLFLDEYELKGYSSIGTPLSSFHNRQESKVQIALNKYKLQTKQLSSLYKKLGLNLSQSTKDSIKSSIFILDEKIGIEMTEPNQIVGLNKKYKHLIFIGTDINHFPPRPSDNFLYSYDDELKYFYANNYFTSSQTQLNELKRLSDNLYIITASYSGKRELAPSILIGSEFDETIDISDVKSISQLALDNQTVLPDNSTKEYYESIRSQEFTKYDAIDITGIDATHLSASQINKYLSCPLTYLYSNKIRLSAPGQEEEGFDVMEQGSLMHLCYEFFGKYIKENNIKSTDKDELYKIIYNISLEAYKHEDTTKNRGDENIHHQIFLSNLQAGLLDERKAGLLAKFVDYYTEKAEEFEYFKNTEFEKEFALDSELKPYKLQDKEDKNYFIKGFIDRFDNLESHINIIDYKSKKMKSKIDKEKMEQIADLKDVQLALYLLYASQEYPDKDYISNLLSFKGDNKYYHFANLSSIDDIKDTHYYDEEYENRLKKAIYDTKASIENGQFGFDNSDEKMCGWCDMKFICHQGVFSKRVLKHKGKGSENV